MVQLRSVPLFEATARKVGAMATADLRDQEGFTPGRVDGVRE